MPINDNNKILSFLYRQKFDNAILDFEQVVKEAVIKCINSDPIMAESIAHNKLTQIWNRLYKEMVEDISNNIVPLFDIVDESSKKVQWIGINDCKKDERKRSFYCTRPDLYKYIDSINDREYEALGCSICEMLGADNIYLTAPSNEGGIDFFANINFSETAHFLFGNKGPIRIVGQCKKYSSRASVSHMKEFIQTINDVHNLSYRAGEIIPVWFKAGKGPILGWHISHSGHQSGALNYAKNYGIIVSDTKELIEIISSSKMTRTNKSQDIIQLVDKKVKDYLDN